MLIVISKGNISIHAPRVGSDANGAVSESLPVVYFNPRSPCGERPHLKHTKAYAEKFQSTLPVWGATYKLRPIDYYVITISIHAPRVGSDQIFMILYLLILEFQSTLPVWGATTRRER